MLKYIQLTNLLNENCYILWDNKTKKSYIIDPGYVDIKKIEKIKINKDLEFLGILNTHGHWDHIFKNNELKEKFNIPILIHELDNDFLTDPKLNLSEKYSDKFISKKADIFLKDKMNLFLGKEKLKILHTPGHTPGSVIIYNDFFAFTGDTLFPNCIGYCNFPKGSKKSMKISLNKIKLILDKNVKILSGHGKIITTFEKELKTNLFLKNNI